MNKTEESNENNVVREHPKQELSRRVRVKPSVYSKMCLFKCFKLF